MKKFLTLLIANLFSLLLPANSNDPLAYLPEASPFWGDKGGDFCELRAVWLATIRGIDWPSTYATSSQTIEAQKRELTDMLDRLQLIGINTILLQTRVRATTIYPSALEPWDGCMSGKPGVSPGYDPLAFAISECHRRNMKIQAWVVTIPIGKWNELGCTRLRKKYPKAVVKIGAEGYLNPGSPQTADILCDICSELTKNYDLDGIHLDYIRYPENWKQKLRKDDGRRNITHIVRRIHDTVKAIKPQMKLSCSPLGKFNDLTRYSSRNWNSYNTVCQDAQAWLRDGLMDQLFPMLYYKDNNFYPFAIDWAEACDSRHEVRCTNIAAGLAVFCLDRKEGDWPLGEIIRQLNVCRQIGLGQCFFRAKFLLDNVKGIYDYLRLFNHEAPVVCNTYRRYEGSGVRGYENGLSPKGNLATTQPRTLVPSNALLPNDGTTLQLPPQADTDCILIESLAGNALTTIMIHHHKANISHLPEGVYTVRSVNRKGITHRIGMFRIKRH